MALELRFRKTGKEIKSALRNRVSQLEQRLVKRNAMLDDFMQDKKVEESSHGAAIRVCPPAR